MKAKTLHHYTLPFKAIGSDIMDQGGVFGESEIVGHVYLPNPTAGTEAGRVDAGKLASIFAASPEMLDTLKKVRPFLAEELDVRLKSAERNPTADEAAAIETARALLLAVRKAIEAAEMTA